MGDEDDYVCEVNLKDAPISITHHLEVLGEGFDALKKALGTMPHFRVDKTNFVFQKVSQLKLQPCFSRIPCAPTCHFCCRETVIRGTSVSHSANLVRRRME